MTVTQVIVAAASAWVVAALVCVWAGYRLGRYHRRGSRSARWRS
jgi:hypothetical protein